MMRGFNWHIALISLFLSFGLWLWVKEQRRLGPDCPRPTSCSPMALDRWKQCIERQQSTAESTEEENGYKPLDSGGDSLE